MAGIFIIHAMLLGLAILVAMFHRYRVHHVRAASKRQLVDGESHDERSPQNSTHELQLNGETNGSTSVLFADQAVSTIDSNGDPKIEMSV